MKTCGIEIDNNTAIIIAIEKYDDGTSEICENSTKIILNEHETSLNIKEFADLIYFQLDTIGANSISVIKRQTKGQFSAGALSFKIESIIQCYKGSDVVLVALPTVKAFLKKNPNPLKPKYKYQVNALNTAHYLMEK